MQAGRGRLSTTEAALVSAYKVLLATGGHQAALLSVAEEMVTPKLVLYAAKQVLF